MGGNELQTVQCAVEEEDVHGGLTKDAQGRAFGVFLHQRADGFDRHSSREVWGPQAEEQTPYLRGHLTHLRKKIDPAATGLIETVVRRMTRRPTNPVSPMSAATPTTM